MEYKNTQLLLNKRPKGMPEDDCWKVNSEAITSLEDNEILIDQVAEKRNLPFIDIARIYAMISLSLADSQLAVAEAK